MRASELSDADGAGQPLHAALRSLFLVLTDSLLPQSGSVDVPYGLVVALVAPLAPSG